jgi:molybdate transport system substrate-binding protein
MAAASLRRVLPELIDAYRKRHAMVHLRAAFGASGDLRKRVQDGAPADAVLFANAGPVDELVDGGHVEAGSRKVVAKNDLVLIARADSPVDLTFTSVTKLAQGEKLAIGEPAAVPAGEYAKAAFQKLGSWAALQDRLVFGGDVAAVLAYTRRGEVAAGVVYGTEIIGIPDVRVLDRAKGTWAPTPEVVVGVVRDGERRELARSFLDYIASVEGQHILTSHGFGPTKAV